ncbi:MAG: hypothetical protein M1839_001929 [Geoglossum umbratile]|nr:MAG: hypothetical protein M1839_001929 [Geoglossum umbratile]
MSSGHQSYLIVGAGAFGASTALHLRQSNPSASVTLLDRTPFPCPAAAAHDLNKIIRADYDDIFYMKLALEALEHWRNDPIYKPYYHESGALFAEDTGMGRKCIENYKTLGGEFAAEIITPEDARACFDGIFRDANWTDVKEAYYNPQSGWGEAERALRRVIEAAVDQGVIYTVATVSTISINQKGTCTGIRTEDGRELSADHTILCTGARTAKLLADSAPDREELQVGGRMVAAAAVMGAVRLTPKQIDKFRNVPVFFNCMDHTHGETIPPTPDGLLKFISELSFTRMVYHEQLKKTISIPPDPISQNTWSQDIPLGLKQEVRRVMKHMYGMEAEGLEVETYRMCWDAVTPNQDWVISPHPNCKNLYIATAGSFHSWKFLPTLGAYVVKMLQGKLDQEKASRWAWDRGSDGAAFAVFMPTRDLKDIPGYSELADAS